MTRFDENSLIGIDLEWWLVDEDGRIAQMISSGVGEVPESVLSSVENNDELYDFFDNLPQKSETFIFNGELTRLGALDSTDVFFGNIACKGMYLYDAGLSKNSYGKVYVQVAKPIQPVYLHDFPESIQRVLSQTYLKSGKLTNLPYLNVSEVT